MQHLIRKAFSTLNTVEIWSWIGLILFNLCCSINIWNLNLLNCGMHIILLFIILYSQEVVEVQWAVEGRLAWQKCSVVWTEKVRLTWSLTSSWTPRVTESSRKASCWPSLCWREGTRSYRWDQLGLRVCFMTYMSYDSVLLLNLACHVQTCSEFRYCSKQWLWHLCDPGQVG